MRSPNSAYEGKVYAIDPAYDPNGRAIILRARLPNRDGVLRSGMFARVTLLIDERTEAIVVPETALVPVGQDQFIYRVVDGKAVLTKVKIGQRRRGQVEIVEGLERDAVIVTEGAVKLRDGSAVAHGRPEGDLTMTLSELCIRRPVFATVLSLVVVLVGVVSFSRLTVREYPEHRPAGGPGRDDLPRRQRRGPRKPGHARARGIRSPASRASTSSARSRARSAAWSSCASSSTRDPDAAANDVRDRVGRVRGRLPDEIDEPIISKVEADAQPIMYLAFSSDRHSPLEITDFADRFVKDRLQSITGVAEARIFGERRYAMRIWLDAARLAAYNMTPQDVENALRSQNVEVPAGRIESQRHASSRCCRRPTCACRSSSARSSSRRCPGYPVRLRDVGRAELRPGRRARRRALQRARARSPLGVVKQAVANPLDISEGRARGAAAHHREACPRA